MTEAIVLLCIIGASFVAALLLTLIFSEDKHRSDDL